MKPCPVSVKALGCRKTTGKTTRPDKRDMIHREDHQALGCQPPTVKPRPKAFSRSRKHDPINNSGLQLLYSPENAVKFMAISLQPAKFLAKPPPESTITDHRTTSGRLPLPASKRSGRTLPLLKSPKLPALHPLYTGPPGQYA